jgi:pimeloyl-ACP methyl ester carboxylesterase
MPFANVNGARLYYEQHGSGPDIAFIHGAGGNHLCWWQQVAAFASHFRCTVYDARGWGRSTGEMGVGRWALGTDLVALLEHLGIGRAHIVAQSMGGRAVAGLARLAPSRIQSLLLGGTPAGATNDRIRELQDELRALRGSDSLREHSLAPDYAQREPGMALLYRQINALNPKRPPGLLGRPPASYRGSMHPTLAGLGVPILFIAGEHDHITSPAMIREASSLIPGSRYEVITGAGHSCYFEAAAAWNRLALAFFSSADAASRRD